MAVTNETNEPKTKYTCTYCAKLFAFNQKSILEPINNNCLTFSYVCGSDKCLEQHKANNMPS